MKQTHLMRTNNYEINFIGVPSNLENQDYFRMKPDKKNSELKRIIILCIAVFTSGIVTAAFGQEIKTLVFDVSHGQSYSNAVEAYKNLLPKDITATIEVSSKEIIPATLKDKNGLILLMPTSPFKESEKEAIIDYLRSGGSLLLVFDEERRMSLKGVGVNDIIAPFNIRLTDDAPVRHNCGAIAEESEICAGKWELPYSRGRSIEGGNIIARVYDEGNYIHSAYLKLPSGGKIIVMSDGMAAILLGMPDGERFSGTGPADSKFWGKDSRIYMEEIFTFFLKE
jgi:hypothetical protein